MDVLDDFPQPIEYASFFKRFIAFIIDAILLGFIEEIVATLTGSRSAGLIVEAISAVVYYGALEGAVGNASVGKQLLGLRVCDLDGNDIDLTKAAIRGAGHVLSGFLFFIGFIMALFTSRKQALHDILAGTLVVNA